MDDASPAPAEPPLQRTVLRLALPVLTEQFLSYCVSLVDTYLSGRLGEVSTAATSAVGLAGYVSWLGTLMFGLIGIGTTALVARAWGAGRTAQANRVANQALSLALAMGIVFLILLQIAAPAFVTTLRMEGDSAEIATRYLRVDAFGLVATSVTLAAAAGLRGTGDMRTPMLVLGLVNVVNAICSVALTFGIGPIRPLGVDGIVLGTLIARVTGGAPIAAAHIDELGLTLQVIKESMRVCPPVPLMSRQAVADMKLGPYEIAAGTSVVMPTAYL